MTRVPVLALAAVLLLPAAVRAQAFVSGSQLTRACNGRSPVDSNSCDGYIAGALDTMREQPDLKGKLCPPSGVRLSAMREALGKFGVQRPEEARGPGTALVASFIKTTYPCPAQ